MFNSISNQSNNNFKGSIMEGGRGYQLKRSEFSFCGDAKLRRIHDRAMIILPCTGINVERLSYVSIDQYMYCWLLICAATVKKRTL